MLKKRDAYVVAVVGATGAVGNEIIELLDERNFPVRQLKLFASERSEGAALVFGGSEIPAGILRGDSFRGIDIALFSAGREQSRMWAPVAAESGCVVIDTSNQWRMDTGVPLIVPEVNADDLKKHNGIIASPGCPAILMTVALKPIHDTATIERIVVTTFQSVSGSGKKAMDELLKQTTGLLNFREVESGVYPYQIAFNCLPQIEKFLESGYSEEEVALMNETRKVLGDDSIRITATAVRVPVFRGDSESVGIETRTRLSANDVRVILAKAPGVVVYDAPDRNIYPFPLQTAGKDEVYVGRIREDASVDRGINLWIASDNIRKGAALNAIQIAETLIRMA